VAKEEDPHEKGQVRPRLRLAVAFAIAFAFSVGIYLLDRAAAFQNGLISFSFLLVLPAAVAAFICYVGDPAGQRSRRFYMRVPIGLMLGVLLTSIIVLQEGVICIFILSPLWIGMSYLGAALAFHFRDRRGDDRLYSAGLLLLPLLAMQIEPMMPLPERSATVTRQVEIAAPPSRIWPLLRGIPDVRPGEGRWNVSQDVIGVPRPLGARLTGEGVGAVRRARWDHDIRFAERITEWQPGRRIGWLFVFGRSDGWGITDPHLRPDSPYFRVTTGGYTLTPLGPNRTRLSIDTHYWMRTPVNPYSEAWGQFFLGDLENNLLALVKQRAESAN
jgi:hypothetical protein